MRRRAELEHCKDGTLTVMPRGTKLLECVVHRALGHDHDGGRQTKVSVGRCGQTAKGAVSRGGRSEEGGAAARESRCGRGGSMQ